jgi:diguanylate cyclase (GGDEF)-like protein
VARGYMNLDNFARRDAFAGDSHEIAAALTAQVGIALQRLQLERDLEAERRRYERLASHDPLTGLPNRRLFQDRLEQTVARAHRRKSGVALLYLDLDGFKDVNDTLGHDVGDELLAAAAKRLVEQVRAEDTVARLGGDEFGVILSDVSQREDAGLVATKLGEAIDAPFRLRGRNVLVGVSIGIALYPDDARLSDGLMKAADVAMYRVKQEGKGTFAFFGGART